MPREWVLWDGNCGFCRRWARWVQREDRRGRFRVVPYQEAPSPPMTPDLAERCARALQVVTSGGDAVSGGRAVLHILRGLDRPGPWGLAAVPPFVWLVEGGYRLVAANRGRLGWMAPREH